MQHRLAVVILFSLFSSMGSAAPSQSIRIRLSSAPSTLDWNVATTGSEGAIIQNLMEGLFSMSSRGEPKGVIAKSFYWSKDKKALRIELNTEFRWSDGQKIDSRDFLHSFERLLNPKLNSENASLLFDVIGARDYFLGKTKTFRQVGIELPNHHSIIFHLREPRANFVNGLTHWATFPVRKDNLKLTLGPYLLKTFSKEHIVLAARTKNLEFQTAEFEVIPSGTDALLDFKELKLDYLLQLEDSLLMSQKIKEFPAPGFANPIRVVALLHLNPTRVPANSPEKRRALMALIPVQSLSVANTSLSARLPAPSLIPPGVLGGPELSEVTPFSPKGTFAEISNESLTLAYPNDSLSKSIAEQIQASIQKVKIIIEALPAGELNAASKRYDLVLTLFGLDYLDPDQLFSSFLSQGTHDLFSVSSVELLRMVQTARATESIKRRAILYREMSEYLENKIAIVMPLFYRRRAYLIREGFRFDEGTQGTAKLAFLHPTK